MQSYFYQTFLSAQDRNVLLIGGGGKSTLIKRLANDSRRYARTAAIASLFSFPFPYESSTLISDDCELIRRQLKSELEKYKISYLGKKIEKNFVLPFTVEELRVILAEKSADHFFIEGDHGAGRSVSGLEKVNLSMSTGMQTIITVIGADALNQQRNENWTISKNKLLVQESYMSPNHLSRVYLEHPKILKLRKKNLRQIFFLNKVENLLVENLAIQLAKNLKLGGIENVFLGSIFNSTIYQLK